MFVIPLAGFHCDEALGGSLLKIVFFGFDDAKEWGFDVAASLGEQVVGLANEVLAF